MLEEVGALRQGICGGYRVQFVSFLIVELGLVYKTGRISLRSNLKI